MMHLTTARTAAAILGIAWTFGASAQDETPIYKDPSQPVDARVADLLSRMTLEEKVAQLTTLWSGKNRLLDDDGRLDPEKASVEIPHGIGQIARPSDNFGRDNRGVDPGRTAHETVELVDALQRFLIEETRLGIPALMHEEGLHGYAANDGTHFPQAIALAATWDPPLVERVYAVAAREMRARGVHQALTPVIDIARDPRWGRIEETYGEDPFLVSEMGLASVRGFQGEFRSDRDQPLPPGRVLATLKHMTGHGQPESGTNIGPASISERVLRENFFPPFERAVQEAGAWSVMASYNEIDGVPSHVNRWLLTDVLREEWGFQGVVVADYYAIRELRDRHRVVDSLASSAAQALEAGVDIELPDREAYPELVELARGGGIEMELIDRAVARNLRAKFLAGLFHDPYGDADFAEEITGNDEARQLARETAEKAVVLLTNDGLLPLDASRPGKIAVIGPNAVETLLGGYSDQPRQTVSLLDGVRAYLGDAAEVTFAQGVHITESRNWYADEVVLADPERNRRQITEAAKVAAGADVVILAIGDNEMTSREGWAENHLGDRPSLDLVGEQEELARAVIETGVPTVVVLIHGRPLAITWIAEHAAAIVDAWYLGQETGDALARVLFGDVSPGGKLPVTVPRSVGQLPMFYNHKPTARRGYLFDTTEPLWPFGYGLSYTTFAFENLELEPDEIGAGESTTVSVDVVNTGKRAGDEVAQLYIRDKVSSVTRPVKELKGFERVTLEPDERRTVTFTVGPEQLRFYDRRMQRVVEPGEFEIMVGGSSADLQSVTLTITAP